MKAVLIATFLLIAAPAEACRLLLMGDSNSALGAPANDWGSMMMAEHYPSCGFCRTAYSGWQTSDGLAWTNMAITFCSNSGLYPVTDMIVMLGTNDYNQRTAEQAAANLIAMADIAAGRGVVPHILCPPPVVTANTRNDYLREVCERVVATADGYDVITSSRDLWTVDGFGVYSSDGIHFDGAGRAILADAVADEIVGVAP